MLVEELEVRRDEGRAERVVRARTVVRRESIDAIGVREKKLDW